MSSDEKEKKRKARPKFQPIESKIHEDNLTIEYNKDELEHLLPELTREIHEKRDQHLSFGEVVDELEKEEAGEDSSAEEEEQAVESRWQKQRERELKNPDAIAFIRRCSTVDEAKQIIEYLEKRGELTPELATKFRDQLQNSGLESFGPKKEPGYYERTFSRRIQLRKLHPQDS